MQQLQSNGTYNELWPKTDCYTKEETNVLVSSIDWQVGDVRGTVKNDLSNDWLLCDGYYHDSSSYPILRNYVTNYNGTAQETNDYYDFSLPNNFQIYRKSFLQSNFLWDGTNYLLGGYFEDSSTSYAAIAYTKDFKTWNVSTVATKNKYRIFSVVGIWYENDYYFARVYSYQNNYDRVWYTKDLTASWTEIDINVEQNLGFSVCGFHNNNWVFIKTTSNNSEKIISGSSFSTLTEIYTTSSNNRIFHGEWVDGRWLFSGHTADNKAVIWSGPNLSALTQLTFNIGDTQDFVMKKINNKYIGIKFGSSNRAPMFFKSSSTDISVNMFSLYYTGQTLTSSDTPIVNQQGDICFTLAGSDFYIANQNSVNKLINSYSNEWNICYDSNRIIIINKTLQKYAFLYFIFNSSFLAPSLAQTSDMKYYIKVK